MNALMAEHLGGLTAVHAQQGMANINVGAQNLAQALGVIQNTIIQSQGAVSDDGSLIAALQTASRAPVQGSNDAMK